MVYSVFLWNLKCLASPNPKLGSRSQNINDCHDSHDADHAAFGEVILSIVDAICMQNLKYVALPIPKLDSGSQCLTRHTPLDLPLLYLYTLPIPPKNSWTFIHIFFINPSQCLKIPISPMLGKLTTYPGPDLDQSQNLIDSCLGLLFMKIGPQIYEQSCSQRKTSRQTVKSTKSKYYLFPLVKVIIWSS